MSLDEAAFESAKHQVINRTATGKSIDIAAKEIAEIVAAAVTGIAGAANFANLLGSLKVACSNESAGETVEKTFVDKETKTLAVLRLRKTMTKKSGTYCWCWMLSYEIKVEGEFWVVTAANDAALAKCQAIPTQQALSMLASLTLKVGSGVEAAATAPEAAAPAPTEAMMQTYAVTVPPGVGPGQQFQASLDGQLTTVIVPHGRPHGSSTLHVQIPVRQRKEGRGAMRYILRHGGNVYEGDYEGELKAGKPEGRGVFRYADGEVYDGEWKAGTRDGRGVLRLTNGDVESKFYTQNVPVGEGVRWKACGNVKRLLDGRGVGYISREEARRTAERLGLLLPPGA